VVEFPHQLHHEKGNLLKNIKIVLELMAIFYPVMLWRRRKTDNDT